MKKKDEIKKIDEAVRQWLEIILTHLEYKKKKEDYAKTTQK